MSDQFRIALVGATGLVGRSVIEAAIGHDDVRLVGIARREIPLPAGARMELVVAEPGQWGEVLQRQRPSALICALGTTWKRAGKDEVAFRAVDQELVLQTARAAVAAGVEHMVAISSVGADPMARNFYLRVKGETERELVKAGFKRIDIFHPGLLRGSRRDDMRTGEGLAKIAAPLIDPFLRGKYRAYRSISARIVAEGALELASRKAAGRFFHDNDSIHRAARDWEKRATMAKT
jgi:uncharacterized protein YbjT (DUF2867 family)